jgi:hypothetical protein
MPGPSAEGLKQAQRIEIPVVLDCIDQPDYGTRFRFAFEGQAYDMIGPRMTQLDFITWLPSYTNKTPRCEGCYKIFSPDQPVTVDNIDPTNSGHWHYRECSDIDSGFGGWFNEDGEFQMTVRKK